MKNAFTLTTAYVVHFEQQRAPGGGGKAMHWYNSLIQAHLKDTQLRFTNLALSPNSPFKCQGLVRKK